MMQYKIFKVIRNLLIISFPVLLTACSSVDHSSTGPSDYSIRILGSIFGNVDSVISDPTTAVQTMIRYFNIGLASVVSIVLGYSVFQYTVKGSVASVMQNAKGGGMQLVRISMGLSLMLPIGSGYSPIQKTIFMVVEHGISAANTVYSDVVQSSSAQPIFDTTGITHVNAAAADTLTTDDLEAAGRYVGAEFFSGAQKWADYFSTSAQDAPIPDVDKGLPPYVQNLQRNAIGSSKGWACFYYLYNGYSGSHSDAGDTSADTPDGAPYVQYIKDNSIMYPHLKDCNFMANTMDAEYRTGTDTTLPTTRAALEANAGNFILGAADLFAETAPTLAGLPSSVDDASQQTDGGWLNIGTEIFNIAKQEAQTHASAAVATQSVSTVVQGIEALSPVSAVGPWDALGDVMPADNAEKPCITDDGNCVNTNRLFKIKDRLDNLASSDADQPSGDAGSSGALANDSPSFSGTQSDLSGAVAGMAPINQYMPVLAVALSSVSKSIVNSGFFSADHTTAAPNPFKEAYDLGESCFDGVNGIWAGLMVTTFAAGIAVSVCSCEQPLSHVFEVNAEMIKPLIAIIFLALTMAGILLGYWLPIFPAIVFIFMVVGWLMSVAEALISAPLIALGMTHPEDHDFLGRSEQGLMLLISVFIRPALMVVGMVTSLAVSYAGLFLLNMMIGISLTGGTSMNLLAGLHKVADAGGLRVLILFPGIFLIYGIMVYNVITYTFGMAPDLVKFVNKWIGIPDANDYQATELAKSTLGPMSQVAGAMSKTMGTAGSGASSGGKKKDSKKSKSSKDSDS